MKELEFIGEFVVTDKILYKLIQKHINRYVFASNFAKNKVILDVAC